MWELGIGLEEGEGNVNFQQRGVGVDSRMLSGLVACQHARRVSDAGR